MCVAAFRVVTIALIVLVAAGRAAAQAPPDVWREFAQHVEIGTELDVRLSDGRRVRATLVGVRDDAVLLLPRTRVPVPIQPVPYGQIVRLERAKPGLGAGKAIAIGVASGVGAFFATLAILLAVAE